MTDLIGTPIGAPVVPTSSSDLYPSHKATYGLGGLRTEATIASRNLIPQQRCEEGMLVYVQFDSKYYILNAGFHNPLVDGDWTELSNTIPTLEQVLTAGNTTAQNIITSGEIYVSKNVVPIATTDATVTTITSFSPTKNCLVEVALEGCDISGNKVYSAVGMQSIDYINGVVRGNLAIVSDEYNPNEYGGINVNMAGGVVYLTASGLAATTVNWTGLIRLIINDNYTLPS